MANPINNLVDAYSNGKPAAASLSTVFDIAEIFNAVHGYKPATLGKLPDTLPVAELGNLQSVTKQITNLYGQPYYSQDDMLGYEVFCPVTIEVNGKDYYLPYTVVSIRRSKTMVVTDMTELDGAVIEIIGKRPFDITIKGFLLGQYGQLPDEGLKAINDAFEYNGSVRIKSAYTDIFLHANDYAVIFDMDIPAKPKVIGVRDFSFQAISDSIFTLYQN